MDPSASLQMVEGLRIKYLIMKYLSVKFQMVEGLVVLFRFLQGSRCKMAEQWSKDRDSFVIY